MNRVLRLMAALVLLLAACGGGDEGGGDPTTAAPSADGATTTATAAPTTTPPAVTVGNDFCGFVVEYANNSDFSPVGFTPAEVEAAFGSNLAALNQAASIAPGEIRDDVQLFVDAYSGFVDFLSEYGWNFLAMPEDAFDDPRLAALEDPALDAAGKRVEEFCGVENFIATAPSDPGGGVSGGGTVPGGQAPEDFPAALTPPGGVVVASISAGGGASVTFDVDGSVADLIDFYTAELGPPVQTLPDPAGALWITQYEGSSVTVTVVETGPGTSQANVTLA